MHEDLSYDNDLTFIYEGVELKTGKNIINPVFGLEIELKKIPVEYFGTCHLLQESGHHNISYDQVLAVKPLLVYIGYKEGLKPQDIPKSFKVYLTAKNDWHGLVMKTWTGYQHPFQIGKPNF